MVQHKIQLLACPLPLLQMLSTAGALSAVQMLTDHTATTVSSSSPWTNASSSPARTQSSAPSLESLCSTWRLSVSLRYYHWLLLNVLAVMAIQALLVTVFAIFQHLMLRCRQMQMIGLWCRLWSEARTSYGIPSTTLYRGPLLRNVWLQLLPRGSSWCWLSQGRCTARCMHIALLWHPVRGRHVHIKICP